MEQIQFKCGSYQLNDDPNFNFQLNRVIQWDGGRLEDIEPIARRIRICADWKRELIALGDRAAAENRIENAIGYYRMSEFFMFDGDPDKQRFYRKATDMFYEWAGPYFESGAVRRLEAPYEDVKLPILYAEAIGTRKGVILLHGGNDSYLEEFFFPMLYLARNGYAVYLFEGPGQGGVVRVQGKKFTHEWERPVKAPLSISDEPLVIIIKSRSFPPNEAQLTFKPPTGISALTDPKTGSKRQTFRPPHNAIHRFPSSSAQKPSGQPDSFGIENATRRFASVASALIS